MSTAEQTANEVLGIYLWADDAPPEVVLDQALTTLQEAQLTPEQQVEALLYLAQRLAERL